jgi:hypothetical protein
MKGVLNMDANGPLFVFEPEMSKISNPDIEKSAIGAGIIGFIQSKDEFPTLHGILSDPIKERSVLTSPIQYVSIQNFENSSSLKIQTANSLYVFSIDYIIKPENFSITPDTLLTLTQEDENTIIMRPLNVTNAPGGTKSIMN